MTRAQKTAFASKAHAINAMMHALGPRKKSNVLAPGDYVLLRCHVCGHTRIDDKEDEQPERECPNCCVPLTAQSCIIVSDL